MDLRRFCALRIRETIRGCIRQLGKGLAGQALASQGGHISATKMVASFSEEFSHARVAGDFFGTTAYPMSERERPDWCGGAPGCGRGGRIGSRSHVATE